MGHMIKVNHSQSPVQKQQVSPREKGLEGKVIKAVICLQADHWFERLTGLKDHCKEI